MDNIISEHKDLWVWPTRVASQFERCVRVMNLCITKLGLRGLPRNVALWNFTIKMHALEHIALESHLFNPTLVWNFSPESFMMNIRTLMQGCKGQKSGYGLQQHAFMRWLQGFEMAVATCPGWWGKESSCTWNHIPKVVPKLVPKVVPLVSGTHYQGPKLVPKVVPGTSFGTTLVPKLVPKVCPKLVPDDFWHFRRGVIFLPYPWVAGSDLGPQKTPHRS